MIAVGHTGCRRSIGQHADGMFRPYRAEDRRGPLAQGGAPPTGLPPSRCGLPGLPLRT
jgi:hypothetical protein